MVIFPAFGKPSLFFRPLSCSRRNLPYLDRFRHAQPGKIMLLDGASCMLDAAVGFPILV